MTTSPGKEKEFEINYKTFHDFKTKSIHFLKKLWEKLRRIIFIFSDPPLLFILR